MRLGCLTAGLFLWAVSAPAAVLLSDNFDADTVTLNSASLINWSVARPAIDLVAHNTFSIECLGNTGRCVDLDGSQDASGRIESNTLFTFETGVTYTLTYWLSGNSRNNENDSVRVSLGNLGSNSHTLAGNAPFAQFVLSVVGNGSQGRIIFDSTGTGNNVGLILDNVTLSDGEIPEPGTWTLFGSALAGLAMWRRRTK